ncbi:MAG: hypothetical protein ACT4PL_08465 [Phycisphaerales bacterium]
MRRSRLRLSARGMLVFVMIGMGVLCMVPGVIALTEPVGMSVAERSGWPIWVLVGVYSPLSGALWPLVESYVSGGRSGADLRSVTGKFNVAWSGALVVTLLAISALVKERPIEVLTVLGGVHLLCVLNLRWFTPDPAEHVVEHHAPPPASYAGLLTLLRVLLPVAFLVLAALAPSLPAARERLGLGPAWGTTLAAGWMIARVGAFFAMERWQGWHGRWSVPLAGGGLLLAAFAVLICAPALLTGPTAIIVFFAGLLAFGVGVGVVYCAALYYALEVGQAEVDAGGRHETLIGIGYTVGPLCGLVACGLAARGTIESATVEPLMLALVAGLALLGAGLAVWMARRGARRSARMAPR